MDQFYFEVNLIFLAKSKVRSERKPGKVTQGQNSKAHFQDVLQDFEQKCPRKVPEKTREKLFFLMEN